LQAARVPLKTAELALDVLTLAVPASARGNSNAITDAWSAGTLAYSAISCAGANVRINLAVLPNYAETESINKALSEIEEKSTKLLEEIRTNIKDRSAIVLL
jgi:glutamate formiminotransferase/formiminotetrahydrofolate cyclodeaminase